ncbi:hypothetical protein GE107_06475 [Cohnella sp. CFH 77786]|uniref:hypothetical protein n=1 Tax=Cohnella sp. CFH 77786 TaxID=2662265 RepID=UPI001C60EDFE|nr:hypothetical protein [Cohnella sp. CFH 77786]MBW5445710.1 hypothetical protein [Cohnella sp. CFH 77786]
MFKKACFALGMILLVGSAVWMALRPAGTDGNPGERVIAYVNQEPIEVREFALFLDRAKANVFSYFHRKYGAEDSPSFWTSNFAGEVPLELAKRAAMEELAAVKVQQLMAREYGVLEDIGYGAFLENLSRENERRKQAARNGQAIYGPLQYDESGYYRYVYSNAVIELKKVWSEREVFLRRMNGGGAMKN